MKLKNIIYSVSLCAAALIPVACDDVAEDDRFIYVEPAEVAKCVLIEDFTGQRCVNCPDASEMIETLQEEYGADNVIAVGIYGGSNGTSLPNGTLLPLYTEAGGWYYDYWGVAERAQPFGMVDRQGFTLFQAWAEAVYSNIQKQAEVMLEAECAYDEASRNVEITVAADGLANIDGSLQVWLTEDSVTSIQYLTGNVIDYEYVHNHVFRATVNGQMGDDISIIQGERVEREFTYEISQDWKPEDMSVVAFIYNDTGVLQTVKAKLIPTQSDENQPAGDNVEGA